MELAPALPSETAPWDGLDLLGLMTLDALGPNVFVSRFGDRNLNRHAFGGQLLGTVSMAAPQDRTPSTLQVQFAQGAYPDEPIVFHVTVLQEGRRLSTREPNCDRRAGELRLPHTRPSSF